MILAGDVGDERFCRELVERIVRDFGRLDVLVNNAAEQHPQETIEKITADQLERIIAENGHPLKELMDKARIDEDDVWAGANGSNQVRGSRKQRRHFYRSPIGPDRHKECFYATAIQISAIKTRE